ncbi:MAG: CARDB domain-containing protein [Dehalococcoidia bacterium]
MKNKNISAAMIFLALAVIVIQTGCQPSMPPAQFDVSNLSFQPAQATVGDTVGVSADVSNNGGMLGVYRAMLSIEGTSVQSKDVELAPGTSQTVKFLFSQDKPGTYEISIGSANASYTIGPKLTQQEMEIKNDNSVVTDYLAVVKPFTGYVEAFTAPPGVFTINSVRINGMIYGGHGFQIQDIELQILDKDKKVLFRDTYPGNKFPVLTFLTSNNIATEGTWVDLEVPDVKVQDNFYVHIYTGPAQAQGFRMGVSDKLGNTHSDLTIRDLKGIDNTSNNWPYAIANWFGDKNRVNWMVHVEGTATVPIQ